MFVMVRMTPGDPVQYLVDPSTGSSEELLAARRTEFGLDRPLPVQYVLWLREVARGNLGYSFSSGHPVSELIGERIGPTVRLMGTALLLALIVGVPLGMIAALRQYSVFDYVIAVMSLAAVSTPLFFLALASIYVLSLRVDLFPSGGMVPVNRATGITEELHHLILPASVLAMNLAGPVIRYTRASALEVMRQDYLTTARAKGLRERTIVFVHMLRNALIPVVSVVGVLIPVLFGGSVIVEQIFSWPGMGQLVLISVGQRNYPVLMGITLVVATVVLLTSILTDIAYAVIDPRIRFE